MMRATSVLTAAAAAVMLATAALAQTTLIEQPMLKPLVEDKALVKGPAVAPSNDSIRPEP